MPHKQAENKVTWTMSMEREMLEELRRISKIERRSVAWIVREALRYTMPRMKAVVEKRAEFEEHLRGLAEFCDVPLVVPADLGEQLNLLDDLEGHADAIQQSSRYDRP